MFCYVMLESLLLEGVSSTGPVVWDLFSGTDRGRIAKRTCYVGPVEKTCVSPVRNKFKD